MSNKFKATFSNTRVITRTSQNRTYSHAWQMSYRLANRPDADIQLVEGWASTRELAEKALASEISRARKHYATCPKGDSYATTGTFLGELVAAEVVK